MQLLRRVAVAMLVRLVTPRKLRPGIQPPTYPNLKTAWVQKRYDQGYSKACADSKHKRCSVCLCGCHR